jgi:hypothetical protein
MFLYIKNDTIFYISENALHQTEDQLYTTEGILNYYKNTYEVVEIETREVYNFEPNKYKLEDGNIVYVNSYHEQQDKWYKIRVKRDALLIESDDLSGIKWVDYWNSKDENHRTSWSEYRQALRDLPQSSDNPDDINWPAIPIPVDDENPEEAVVQIP